jgi:hypothetical protein
VHIGPADHADEVFRADVGGEDGCADGVPWKPIAGEKVIAAGCFLAPGQPHALGDDADEIEHENRQIDRRKPDGAGEHGGVPPGATV